MRKLSKLTLQTGASVQPSAPNRPPPGYRPRGPEDRRGPPPPRPPRGPVSPDKRGVRPPPLQRRASESSVMEKERRPRMDRDRDERPERTESEERRRRERRREREERHKREKEKVRSGEKRSKKPQGLDIIDKLDVTGIYGQGRKYRGSDAFSTFAHTPQSFTTMVHSMLATRTAMQRKIGAHQCKLSQWALPTWRLAALVH